MARFEGGCLCGAVRYEADGEPAVVAVCHCRTCQKVSGASYSYNLGMPTDAVRITGETHAVYEDRSGASGEPFERHFCSRCGSSIAGRGNAYEGLTLLKAGTLDDPEAVKPSVHIWGSEKLSWVPVEEGSAVFEKNPG
ncbi:MAG: GFA family protein [Pseudomonadota bacterium]